MPDYMYSLESRLSAEQRAAMVRVQELAAAMGANVYLTGGAVRDLISGAPIRDLDFTLEGNPSRLARELEKGGAEVIMEDERLRQIEVIFAGGCAGSLAGARDDFYSRPGTKPEIRWSTIMEDLRRRDFSLNAIAISLNTNSRGLLLDPTNGLSDIESHEVRALSIHSFTNQPVRLLRALRYAARMGFKLESRTAEWFALAIERGMHEQIPPEDAGRELQQVAREDRPAPILKAWEAHGLIAALHPQLARRHPDYEALQRLMKVREDLVASGLRPGLTTPAIHAILGRLKARERRASLLRMGYRSAENEAILGIEEDAQKAQKLLAGRKTADPVEAFRFLEKLPLEHTAYILAESSNSKVLGKIRNYLHKWRPLRLALPSVEAELEGLGMSRGPKFERVIEEVFKQQLLGKGRNPEDRIKLLRKLSGIKEPPKKKIKEEKRSKGAEKFAAKRLEAHAAHMGKQKGTKVATPATVTPRAASVTGASVQKHTKTRAAKVASRAKSRGQSKVSKQKKTAKPKKPKKR
jgi:tRNA nucleotidyltransferase (CCA-adding enzyme)